MIIALVIMIVAVVSWMMFEAGNMERRMPKMDNDGAEWWRSIEDSEQEKELLEYMNYIRSKNQEVADVSEEDTQPLPF